MQAFLERHAELEQLDVGVVVVDKYEVRVVRIEAVGVGSRLLLVDLVGDCALAALEQVGVLQIGGGDDTDEYELVELIQVLVGVAGRSGHVVARATRQALLAKRVADQLRHAHVVAVGDVDELSGICCLENSSANVNNEIRYNSIINKIGKTKLNIKQL